MQKSKHDKQLIKTLQGNKALTCFL